MTSYWARWRLKSPASPLFTQPFIQAQIKENIKAPSHWPLRGEFTGDRWIPHTKGQWHGKCFHWMASSWIKRVYCFLYSTSAETTLKKRWIITDLYNYFTPQSQFLNKYWFTCDTNQWNIMKYKVRKLKSFPNDDTLECIVWFTTTILFHIEPRQMADIFRRQI